MASEYKELIEEIKSNSINNGQRISEDTERFLTFNGRLREVIKTAISREFKNQKTVKELVNRIVPINITQKIINKLSRVYSEDPVRFSVDRNPKDQDLIDMYEATWDANNFMRYANQMFELHKITMLQPYLDMRGIPRIRVLPSQTFSLFSEDYTDPSNPTQVVVHLEPEGEKQDQRYALWTDERHIILDGNGDIVWREMEAMNNPDGENTFGELPFVVINKDLQLLYPIRDDDLITVQIIINLLLTDLAFALKYMAFSTMVIIGSDSQKLDIGPASLLQMPFGPNGEKPEIDIVKPELDSDALIRTVENLVSYLLSTKNLSVGTVAGKLDVNNLASGISKTIDQAEATEMVNTNQDIFSRAENKLWNKFAHVMLPVWIENGEVNKDYAGSFSPDFEFGIKFKDVKPVMTEKEKIEIVQSKLQAGFTTMRRALKELNPDMSAEEINALIDEINKEKAEFTDFLTRNMQEGE